MNKFSERECKSIIFKLAIKYGIAPNLISTRLLSRDDRVDMMNGDVPIESLEIHVKRWIECGCEDMVNRNMGK